MVGVDAQRPRARVSALSDAARKTCSRKRSLRGRACLYPPFPKHRPTWCFVYRILPLAIYPCTAFFLLPRSSFPSYGRKFVYRGSTAVTEGEHRDEKSAIMKLLRLPSENRHILEQKERCALEQKENEEIVRQMSLLGPAIATKIAMFAKRASVVDAKFREDVLMRVVSVHDMFVSLFSDGLSDDSISEVRLVEEAIGGMLRFVSVAQPLVLHIRLLSNLHIQDAYATCRQFFSRQRSSIFYVLQHNLVTPILNAQDTLFRVMAVLVDETNSNDLRKFQSMLGWAAAAWEGVLSVSEKTAVDADDSIIDYEHILRLEHNVTLNQLCRHLEAPIDELLRSQSDRTEKENVGNAMVTKLTAVMKQNREVSRKQRQNAADTDDNLAEDRLSTEQTRETASEGKQEDLNASGLAEKELSRAKHEFASSMRRAQDLILEKMYTVDSVFASNKGWKYAQNAEQLVVVKEIQHILRVWNGLDENARSDLVGPAEDLAHATGTCPVTAALQAVSPGALNSPLLQIPVFLVACEGGETPHAPVLKGSSVEIYHVRVTPTPKNFLLHAGETKIMFLFDHLAVLPVTAVLLYCGDTETPGPVVRSILHITGQRGCDRQNSFVSEMLETFRQEPGDFVVATDTILPDEPRSTGTAGLNENLFKILCSLAACRRHHGRDLQELESSRTCSFYVGEGVSGDANLRQEIDKRIIVLRSLPERSTPNGTSGTSHEVMEIFQSVFDEIQRGLQHSRDPSAQSVKVLERLQVHIKQQSCESRQAELHSCAERAVPKSPFERARLADFLESKGEAFPNMSPLMLAVIDREPCAQTIVNRSRCAVKLLNNVQRLLAFVAKFQRMKVNKSSVDEVGDIHALFPLVFCFKYNIMIPVIRAVVKEDGNLVIARGVSQKYFFEKQKQLDELLQRLAIPPETLEKFGLSTILVEVAESLPATTSNGGASKEAGLGLARGSSKVALEGFISHLQLKLKHATSMASPPRHLMAALNKHLKELEAYNTSDGLGVSDDEMKRRKVAIDKLCSRLVEYEASLAAEDPVISKLPKELLALKHLCGQIAQDVRELTGNRDETRTQLITGAISVSGDSARIALEMVAERNGILKLIDLLPTTRDADARRALQRQAVTLMLPALGSQDVEPEILRRDVLLASAAKRARSLIEEPAASLLGSMSTLQENFQTRQEDGDLVDKLQKAALSDVVGAVSKLHAKRLDVLNVVNSFDGETLLRVCPVSLSIADVFGLTAIACPATIDYGVRLQAAADNTLNRWFGSGRENPSTVELPMLPPELTDGKPEIVLRTDLCTVSLIDDENNAEISKVLLKAMVTIRKVFHGALGGGVMSDCHHPTKDHSDSSEMPLEDARLRPAGIVSATDEWIPLQLFLCCVLIELCGSISEQSVTRRGLTDMLQKYMTIEGTLTVAVEEQETLVNKLGDDLKRAGKDLNKQEHDLCTTSVASGDAGSAPIGKAIKTIQKRQEELEEKLRDAQGDLDDKKREFQHKLDENVRVKAEELHDHIKTIFSKRPFGSNTDAMSAEALYENVVTLSSWRRESFFSDLSERGNACLKDISRARDLLLRMIDRNVAAEDLFFSRLLHLLDVCKLAMHGMKNTAGCLTQYLTTVETSGGLLSDFVAATAPRLEQVFTHLEGIFVEAKKDCSDFDILKTRTSDVLSSLEGLRETEGGFSWGVSHQHGDNSPSRSAATRSVSTLVNTAHMFCIRAVFVSLSDVRARQLHSDQLDECFAACWQEAVRLNDHFLLALNDHELVIELDLLRHQRATVEAVLRGTVLHAAFGIASSPFELVCLLQKTIGTVDVQALAPAYATQLLVQDWLKPMGFCVPGATSSKKVEVAATPNNLSDVLTPLSHLRALKDGTAVNSSTTAHDSFVKGMSGRVEAVSEAVTYLDGTFMAWGAGHVRGLLKRLGESSSEEQAKAAGRLTTVFQELVRALVRQLLLMCSNSVRLQVATSVAGLQPLKERLSLASTGVLVSDDGGSDAAPMLNLNAILLVDSLRVSQWRHGEGDITHLDTLQLEIRSEARLRRVAAPDAKMSGLATAENLSDLLFVGTIDMCGPLQLLLRSTLDISTCCEMVRLYADHALECVEALYSALADVMENGEIRRPNEGHTTLLQELFEAEDIFVKRVVNALRGKVCALLSRHGTNEAPEINYYHGAQQKGVRAIELAEELLAEGECLLNKKYEVKQGIFDASLARVEGKYKEWLDDKDREESLYTNKMGERQQRIEAAENRIRQLLLPPSTTRPETANLSHESIMELFKKYRCGHPVATDILKQAINDHYDSSVTTVVLRLEYPPKSEYKLQTVNATIGDDKQSHIEGKFSPTGRFWDIPIPFDRLDPEGETSLGLVQRWVTDTIRGAVGRTLGLGTQMVYRTDCGLISADIAAGRTMPRRRLNFDHVTGKDFATGELHAYISIGKTISTWTPKDSVEVTTSCRPLRNNIEKALDAIPQEPKKPRRRYMPETPDAFRAKYGARLAEERDVEEQERGGRQGEFLRGVAEKISFLTNAMDNTVENLARMLNPSTVSDDGAVRFARETEEHGASKMCYDLIASGEDAIQQMNPLLKYRIKAAVVGDSLTTRQLSQPAHALATEKMGKLHQDLLRALHCFCVAMQDTACMQWGDALLLSIGIDAASAQGPAIIKLVLGELKRARDLQDRSLAIWARERKDPILHASKIFHCANFCDNIDEMLKRRQERMLLLHGAAKRAETLLTSEMETGDLSGAFDSKQARAHASMLKIQVSWSV